MNILDDINSPEDMRELDPKILPELCSEIREFLIDNISKTGGHLASNLGTVELTVAIHRVFDTAIDRLVFDVGHQSYTHKILTGRREKFDSLRCLGGIAGFPKPEESIHDAFIAGHASAAVSTALGMAKARSAKGEDYSVIALLGDGALTGGLAYEGLCNAGASGEPIVVILNDNGMSINKNVGGISKLLANHRLKPSYLSFKRLWKRTVGHIGPLYRFAHRVKERIKDLILGNNMFEDFGFQYFGPVDGHDIAAVETTLRWAKEMAVPVIVHVTTQKGKGYAAAEESPEMYHGVAAFDPDAEGMPASKKDFSAVFGETLIQLAQKDESIHAITAAMESGTGLREFAKTFEKRFHDVGIAEGHAVSMAAGMAKQGLIPVFAVYSSFLQRSYDMLIHDVSLQKLHVVLGVDRAGIVGKDGETHNGAFDIAYLSSVPNMAILCPASFMELKDMLEMAIYRINGPVALRYPRGCEGEFKDSTAKEAVAVLKKGTDITLVTHGIMINQVLAAARILEERGVSAEVLKINLVNPLSTKEIAASVEKTGRLVTAEDVCKAGSAGEAIMAELASSGIAIQGVRCLNLGNGLVTHGEVFELLEKTGLSANAIANAALELVSDMVKVNEKSKA